MKNLLSIASLLATGFLFSGCPYESEVPIDAPSVKTNASLLGDWVRKDEDNEVHYLITAKDDFTYAIAEENQQSGEVNQYTAHASVVKGVTLINLKPHVSGENTKYTFYRLTITSENEFTLADISENVDEQFTSSTELRKFISSNMNKSFFYSKEELTFIRKVN